MRRFFNRSGTSDLYAVPNGVVLHVVLCILTAFVTIAIVTLAVNRCCRSERFVGMLDFPYDDNKFFVASERTTNDLIYFRKGAVTIDADGVLMINGHSFDPAILIPQDACRVRINSGMVTCEVAGERIDCGGFLIAELTDDCIAVNIENGIRIRDSWDGGPATIFSYQSNYPKMRWLSH
jgi:hypothetical protein